MGIRWVVLPAVPGTDPAGVTGDDAEPCRRCGHTLSDHFLYPDCDPPGAALTARFGTWHFPFGVYCPDVSERQR